MSAWPKPVKREKASKPLRRSKPLRARGKTKYARRERDFAYMGFVASRPCLARLLSVHWVGCEGRIHVHHAFGRRVADSDLKTIPLCDKHHREWHEHRRLFEGWDRDRRNTWSLWAVEFTRLERDPAPPLGEGK